MFYIFSKKSIDLKNMTKQISIASISKIVLSIFLYLYELLMYKYFQFHHYQVTHGNCYQPQ